MHLLVMLLYRLQPIDCVCVHRRSCVRSDSSAVCCMVCALFVYVCMFCFVLFLQFFPLFQSFGNFFLFKKKSFGMHIAVCFVPSHSLSAIIVVSQLAFYYFIWHHRLFVYIQNLLFSLPSSNAVDLFRFKSMLDFELYSSIPVSLQ